MDYQGGKNYGAIRSEQEQALDETNKAYRDRGDYKDVEDLDDKLRGYKANFMEFDENCNGAIDIMELKRMMEKLGQAKTHLELKKMITELDKTNSGDISYTEFLDGMLGKQNSILKLILMFEEKKKGREGTQ